MRRGSCRNFLEALAADWPEEVERYEQLYAGRAYVPEALARPIKEHVRAAALATPFRRRARRPAPALPPPQEQLQLVL